MESETNFESVLSAISSTIKEGDQEYIKTHPELAQMVSDYMISMVESKPDNVKLWTHDYFSIFRQRKDTRDLTPLLIVGPSGCGKVSSSNAGYLP